MHQTLHFHTKKNPQKFLPDPPQKDTSPQTPRPKCFPSLLRLYSGYAIACRHLISRGCLLYSLQRIHNIWNPVEFGHVRLGYSECRLRRRMR